MSGEKRTTTVLALPEFSLVSKLVPSFAQKPLVSWVNDAESRIDAAIEIDRYARLIPKDAQVLNNCQPCRVALQWVAMEIAAGCAILPESGQSGLFEKYVRGDMAPKTFYERIAMGNLSVLPDEESK